jgi:hemoglobin
VSKLEDVESRADIDRLMQTFYERAIGDDVIGYIFTEVAKLDLEHHLPIIGDFWESLLFGTPAYQKHGRNPMLVHKDLHAKSPLTPEHFERWLEIFTATVDDLFDGENADHLKMRAGAIAARILEFLGIASGTAAENRMDPG